MLWLALVTAALAGDPCPIDIRLASYTPEWRDQAEDLNALTSKARWMGLTYAERGDAVVVTRVYGTSPAEAAGVSEGDRIVAVRGEPTATERAVSTAIDKDRDGPVAMTLSRDGVPREVSVPRGPIDPVLHGLFALEVGESCRDVQVVALTDAQRAQLAKAAFNDQRGFQCDDAHTRLDGFEQGTVVVIRGGRRVLVTMPGWHTECVAVADFDGANATMMRFSELAGRVTRAYVKDRHDNP